MKRGLLLAVLVAAFGAGATPKDDQALLEIYARYTTAVDDARYTAESQLAVALEKRGLFFSAFIFQAAILKAGKSHPYYLRSVEALVRIQRQLDDRQLIPNLLNMNFSNAWETLPVETLPRVNLLISEIDLRKSKLEECADFADAVPGTSPLRAKALYLKALALDEPRRPGGPKSAEAIAALQQLLALGKTQESFEDMSGLANLALGRIFYELGRYPESVAAYAAAQKSKRYRATALFEGAFAQFLNEDPNGALAALRAPEVANGFFPEAVLLEAHLHYFGMRYAEADAALDRMQKFEQLTEKLRSRLATPDPGDSAALVRHGADELPPVVFAELRFSGRLMSALGLADQIDKELAAVAAVEAWKGTPWAKEVTAYLEQNKTGVVYLGNQFALNRLRDVGRSVAMFSDFAILMRFEIALARSQLTTGAARFDAPLELLRKVIPKIEAGSPAHAELIFHLADLTWQKASALPRPEAKLLLTEALRLDESVLKDCPTYERTDEVLYASGNLKEWLDDPVGARALYVRLIEKFPKSPLLKDASARRDWIRK